MTTNDADAVSLQSNLLSSLRGDDGEHPALALLQAVHVADDSPLTTEELGGAVHAGQLLQSATLQNEIVDKLELTSPKTWVFELMILEEATTRQITCGDMATLFYAKHSLI